MMQIFLDNKFIPCIYFLCGAPTWIVLKIYELSTNMKLIQIKEFKSFWIVFRETTLRLG